MPILPVEYTTMNALVTNAGNRIAYNIVRSLGQKGIPVHTCDLSPLSMSFCSRYSQSHFVYPSPFSHPEEFIHAIIEGVHRLNVSVLLPVFEETYLISKYMDVIKQHVKMAIPDYSKILITHNKDRWIPICDRLGIPTPKTWAASDFLIRNAAIDKTHFPVLIKPKQGGGGWGMGLASNDRDLEKLLAAEQYHNLPWDRFFVQEMVNGPTHCVAMLFRHGELRAKVGYEQLREYPIGAGQATLRISRQNEQAEAFLQKLLEHLEWHGVCQADFVINEKSGIPYLVDINPRLWGSLVQGIASGVDFPYLTYQMALNGDVKPVDTFKTGVMTRWIGGDLRTFFPLLKKSPKTSSFIRDFFWNKANHAMYDDFTLSDPVPFFCWCIEVLFRIIRDRSFSPSPRDSLKGIWQ